MIAIGATALLLTAAAQVSLRGGEPAPAGAIVAVDAGGVWLGPPAGAAGESTKPGSSAARSAGTSATPILAISWDRVKSIQGPAAAPAKQWLPIAEQAWRARTRLERGDVVAAEPLFERLFLDQFRSRSGPTAAVIAEGLLRCRLHRGAHVAAVEPWLALLHATSSPVTPILHSSWASEAGLAPVIDPQTGLAPALPPMWLAWPSVEALAKSDGPLAAVASEPGVESRIQMLGALYTQSARFEAGLPASIPSQASNDPGVALVWQIVQARLGERPQREEARRALNERLAAASLPDNQTPVWQQAWCHAAIGRSLLRETSPEERRLGVVALLNVPARFARVHPYLSGMCLAEASAALRDLGDAAGADVLANELFREYPTHPALDWGPMRTFVPKSDPTPAAPMPRPAEPGA